MSVFSVLKPVVFAGALFAAAPVYAASSDVQHLTYEVYAGGVNAVNATLKIDADAKDKYALSLHAGTKGFLRKLAPWDGTFETQGWTVEKGDRPEVHRSTAIWRGEEDVKEYRYNKAGKFISYSVRDPEETIEKDLPPAELTQDTVDILTATLDVMRDVANGNDCSSQSEVFDGKRRFILKFTLEGHEDLEASRYNVYSGPAQRCVVEVVPVAGAWHKKPRGLMSIQEQGRVHGKLPTVWFGQVSPDKPAVPVKVRVTSDYGTMFMHMTSYKDDQKELRQ